MLTILNFNKIFGKFFELKKRKMNAFIDYTIRTDIIT